MSHRPRRKHWYRELWPLLLMLPPAAAVLAGTTMLYLAVHVPNPLAVDDYARIEEITATERARDRRAAEVGVGARLTLEPTQDALTRIEVVLTSQGALAPEALGLRLRHVTNADADRALTLLPAAGAYSGATALAAGRYDLELVPPDGTWRLAGPLVRTRGTLELAPRAAD
jgi:uncharacterized protein